MDQVTAIVTTFERPGCLNTLLTTLRNYYPDLRVLVADDSFRRHEYVEDEHTTVYQMMPDIGISAKRNWLVDQVDTAYTLLLDDDFVFERRTSIGLMRKYLSMWGNVDILAGDAEDLQASQGFRAVLERDGDVLRLHEGHHGHMGPLVRYDLVLNFFLARTEALRRVRWREELKVAEHIEFFARAKEEGLITCWMPRVTIRNLPERSKRYGLCRSRSKVYLRMALAMNGIRRLEYNGVVPAKDIDIGPDLEAAKLRFHEQARATDEKVRELYASDKLQMAGTPGLTGQEHPGRRLDMENKRKAAVPGTVGAVVRLPRRVLEALEAASEALEDLGACDDPSCMDQNCNHALTKVRDVLAEQ